MNIFNKIGNIIEETKKKKEIFKNKYWKLSASERIDYDNRLEKIKKQSEVNFFHFTITKLFLIYIFIAVIFSFLAYFGINSTNEYIELLRPLSFLFLKLLYFMIVIDFILSLLFLFYSNSKIKIKELNKRFKL